jgi:hypothetical protein
MKSQHFFNLIIMITILFSACKKDYRDNWAGTYECERIYQSTITPPFGDPYPTYYDTTRVIVNVTTKEKGLLHIEERDLLDEYGYYNQGIRHDVEVNTDGNFSGIHDGRPLISGNFNKDNLNINYHDWSPGGTIYISYKGKKQK